MLEKNKVVMEKLTLPDSFINKIINADCLEAMKQIPDGSIDLVLTDPPYGIKLPCRGKNYGTATHKSRKATNDSWDDFIPDKRYFDEMFRVSRNQIIFGANYFWENFYSSPCYIIWDKRGNLPDVPFAPVEFAWTSFKQMSKKYISINHGFISDTNDHKLHPTQKPTELMKMIVKDFTKQGDLVLDPFLGSGTTTVACKELGRNYIGIEISERYCAIARERLRQTELLTPKPEEKKIEQKELGLT